MGRYFETFLTSFRRRLPWWITNPKGDGPAVWSALSLLLDGYMQRAYEGIYARYPTHAPADALGYIGADRRIIRGVGETREGYAARLLDWLTQFSHLTRGSPFALLEQVRAYCGGEGIRVRLVDRRGNWYTIDRDGTKSLVRASLEQAAGRTPPQWLSLNEESLEATVAALPTREDVSIQIDEQLIVEFCSR